MTGSRGLCGARTKGTGKPCRRPAGWGTSNDEGRCKLHGGATPIRHGRYSKLSHRRLGDLLQRYEDDPDPLNLLPELALLRALLEDYVERYDDFRDALVAWYGSENGNSKPRQILDVADAKRLIAEVGRLSQRIHKMWSEQALTRDQFFWMMGEMGKVVAAEVEDEETLERIRSGWLEINTTGTPSYLGK